MFSSPLVPIFLTVLVDVLGMTLMIPLLPFYAEHFGASPLVVGLLFASYAVFQFISGPILGRISDTAGRKPTLIVSQIGTCIGFLILGSANSLGLLFVGRIIDGITAGNLSIAQAYISDVTTPDKRTKAFGLIGIAFGLGFLVGPALSGYLSKYGYQWPAYAAAVLSFTSIMLSTFLLPNIPRSTATPIRRAGRFEQFAQFFRRPTVRRALLEFFMFTLSFSVLIGGLALYLGRRFGYNAEHTGYIFAFSGIIGLIVQGGLLGPLVKRFGEKKLATIGFVAMGGAFVVLGEIYTLPVLMVGIVISGFGSSVVRPTLTALITHSVESHEQGAALGVSQSLQSIAQIVGPVIAGWLIEHDLLGTWGMVAGGFALAGAAMALPGIMERGRSGERDSTVRRGDDARVRKESSQ